MLKQQSIFSLAKSSNGSDFNDSSINEFSDIAKEVYGLVNDSKLIHESRVNEEIYWFFNDLGLDPFYFRSMDAFTIAKHLTSLYASKLLYATNSDDKLALRLVQEKKDTAMYIVPSMPSVRKNNPSESIEYRIEREYLGEGYNDAKLDFNSLRKCGYRVQVYRTFGTVSKTSHTKLRIFFVQKSIFPENSKNSLDADNIELKDVADIRYIKASNEKTQKPIIETLKKAMKQLGPVKNIYPVEDKQSNQKIIRIVVAYRHGTTHNFFSGLTALYHFYGLHSTRKYIEHHSNDMCTYSLYLYSKNDNDDIIKLGNLVIQDASLIYVLPRTSLTKLFTQGCLSPKEVTYAYAIWKFAHQFFSCMPDESEISRFSNETKKTQGLISKVSATIKKEMMTEGRVKEIIFSNIDIIKELYKDFENKFIPSSPICEYDETNINNLLSSIKKKAISYTEIKILSSFCLFNKSVLKTNFYKPGKIALSFRLDPSFIQFSSYPRVPFGIFFVVGAEFRGFHIRFVDVARGGIRIIRSSNFAAFSLNVSSLFEENYNLAHTQQRKNKDIPEGGSKGTILLSLEHQDKALVAFKKYVDALLDLLLPNKNIKDYYKTEEILFLGPDEGTAEYMDWASQHAKRRSYKFWKAFTTGKARSLGGIPHDYYGMTTNSIHEYVLGILKKQNIKEDSITKFQTGGPDGDLGSNEILISKDKTIAVVDGSGVLFDPLGINRDELIRLAQLRQMTNHFDVSKLSDKGFYISTSDSDKKLPDGSIVESGLIFRNTFHLKGKYLFGTDMFVPCGGRPAAVNINNVHHLYDETTNSPMFKYIVEGANLFFTQEARLQLEKWGVILFKDASANKGGVTSSSLEVLAALALNDEEFEKHMEVKDDIVPDFYEEYVEEVLRIIRNHAKSEFECLWREHKLSGTPISILSDLVSEKINDLNNNIFSSSLWNNKQLREKVITSSIPQNLVSLIGKDALMTRVPESYLKAIFGANLACNFVYKCGLNSGEFGFFEFMQSQLSD